MPRIRDVFLECVFYLYRSRESALAGEDMGGTGFVTGVASKVDPKHRFYGYAVTNRHVAIDQGFSCIRVNRRDGGVDVFEFDPSEWTPHPDGDDLAILPFVGISESAHTVKLFADDWHLSEADARTLDIGPGDDVFMVGRFVHHDGKERNEPTVRFGNISMAPRHMQQSATRNYFRQLSYAVELRSMGGYSGSPVFIYRGPWDMRTNSIVVGANKVVRFLGVHWGHIVDTLEVKSERQRVQPQGFGDTQPVINFVQANTGMNGVIPAWRLKELLYMPKFVEARSVLDAAIHKD